MASENRLIYAGDLWHKTFVCEEPGDFRKAIENAPSVDAVEAKKYEALVEMYHDLRENFIDYYCSGTQNVAPYCLNRCEECLTPHGWCNALSDKCRGFNPAEVILDGERKDNG